MSTVNETESTPAPQNPEVPGDATPSDAAPEPDVPEDAAPSADPASQDERPESEGTTLYVRRGRTPTLGFWVALAIVLPALGALLSAPLFDFADLSGVLNFMLMAAFFVGLPLAAIAALVDSLRHRGEKRSRR